MASSMVLKGVMQAYQQAASKGGKVATGAAASRLRRGRMPIKAARDILGIESSEYSRYLVLERYAKLFYSNSVDVGGSLYLYAKIYHAKEALMDELGVPDEEREPAAEDASEEAPASGQIDASKEEEQEGGRR